MGQNFEAAFTILSEPHNKESHLPLMLIITEFEPAEKQEAKMSAVKKTAQGGGKNIHQESLSHLGSGASVSRLASATAC